MIMSEDVKNLFPNIMTKEVWCVAAYMPNHGQHYEHLFRNKRQAQTYYDIQQSNPMFGSVVMHKVFITPKQYAYVR